MEQLYNVVATTYRGKRREIVATGKSHEAAVAATYLWKQYYPGQTLMIEPMKPEESA